MLRVPVRIRVLFVVTMLLLASAGFVLLPAASVAGTTEKSGQAPAGVVKAPKAKADKAVKAPKVKTAGAVKAVSAAKASSADPVAYPVRSVRQDELTLWVPEQVEQGGVLAVRAVWDGPDVTGASLEVLQDGESRRASWRPVLVTGKRALEAVVLLPVPLDAKAGKPILVEARVGNRQVGARSSVVAVDWPLQQITVDKKYVEPPKEVTQRIQRDREHVREALSRVSPDRAWTLPLVRPVPGGVSSSFGGKRMFNGQMRSYHRGVDLRGAAGTPVLAAADGVVLLAEDQYFSGNIVFVDHGQGLVTLYCHLSAMHVKPGDRLKAGQELGLVGATGRVTGPHLHLGALVFGDAVNPLALVALQAMPD